MVYSVSNSTMINFGLVCILPALFVFTALILTICSLKHRVLSYRTKMSWQTFVLKKTSWKNELWFSQVTESEMQTTCDSAKTLPARNSLELKSQQTACFSSLRFVSILLHPLNTAFVKSGLICSRTETEK